MVFLHCEQAILHGLHAFCPGRWKLRKTRLEPWEQAAVLSIRPLSICKFLVGCSPLLHQYWPKIPAPFSVLFIPQCILKSYRLPVSIRIFKESSKPVQLGLHFGLQFGLAYKLNPCRKGLIVGQLINPINHNYLITWMCWQFGGCCKIGIITVIWRYLQWQNLRRDACISMQYKCS